MAQLIVLKTITQAVNEKHLNTHRGEKYNSSTTELLKFLTYSSRVM